MQATFLEHVYASLVDKDVRVRAAAAAALCAYLRGSETSDNQSTDDDENCAQMIFNELVSERVFHKLPAPLCYALEAACGRQSPVVEQRLAKVLFRLTNELLNFGDKHQQVGLTRDSFAPHILNDNKPNRSWAL